MKTIRQLSLALLCAVGMTLGAQASVMGPTYPAPGGNTWSGSGSGLNGTATWNYGGFDTNAFDQMWFGLDNINYGVSGAGLDYYANPFTLYSVSGITAIWQQNTSWYNGSTHVTVPTRLVMTVAGLGSTPWITNLASIGLGAYSNIGAVIDLSSGNSFTLQWKIEANVGSGWQAINSVSQHSSHDGATRTSFATGFYYTEPASVPAPGVLLLLAGGLLLIGKTRRGSS